MSASAPPSVSVVVPTLDRPRRLACCLEALASLDYPAPRLEVLVVDDGGREPLAAVVAPFTERLSLTLHRQRNAGPAAARNAGAARAGGEILAFTDDDCEPSPDWLRILVDRLRNMPGSAAGGRTANGLPGNLYSSASQLIVDLVYSYYNADPANGRFLTANNLALWADGFRSLGGFDERFRTSEDREFCDRWRHSGRHLQYVPEAVVYHSHHLTFGDFWRQHLGYGRGAFRYSRARARRGSGGLLADMGFQLRLPGTAAAAVVAHAPRRGTTAGLLLLWQAANVLGYGRAAIGAAAKWAGTSLRPARRA
jgi:glycosyltransferase involved in cell wall biosynthesis